MMTGVAHDHDQPRRDLSVERSEAMALAVQLHEQTFASGDATAVRRTAQVIFDFLTEAITWEFVFGPVTHQDTGHVREIHFGGAVSQLHADEKVTFQIVAKDSRGNVVPDDPTTDADNVSFTLQEGGDALLELTVGDDDRSGQLVATGSLGSTVVTAEINTSSGTRTITQAIDVIPGEIAAMEFIMGTPVKQDSGEAPAPETGV
jgi:hypothetical protein